MMRRPYHDSRTRNAAGLVLVLGLWNLGACRATSSRDAILITASGPDTQVTVHAPAPIGEIRLWVPEAIMSNTGCSAVYPQGMPWTRQDDTWRQYVEPDGDVGPGNFHTTPDGKLECAGITIPRDQPVAWTTCLTSSRDRVRFAITLTNRGDAVIEEAGAAVCMKFLNGGWWSADHTYVVTTDGVRTLADLGRNQDVAPHFEAYLLADAAYANAFYQRFWTFNAARLASPRMISDCPKAGMCVEITAPRAYFVHNNAGNPCTDVMMAFGDVEPGASVTGVGAIVLHNGSGVDLLR